MGSINLKNLSKKAFTAENTSGKVYVDLHLDIQAETKAGLFTNSRNSIDVKADYDFDAIANSIKNILNTRKRTRPLLPSFGCDLMNYVGESVSDFTTDSIKDVVKGPIESWEPRVKITNVVVTADPDNNEYRIAMDFVVDSINKIDVKITGYFNAENGFYYKGI
jgi:phage baseplate assembly protein W